MRAAARALQWMFGFVIGLGPLASSADHVTGARLMTLLVPGLAALWAWDRYPYFAGGIAAAVLILAGPLSYLLTTCGAWLPSW